MYWIYSIEWDDAYKCVPLLLCFHCIQHSNEKFCAERINLKKKISKKKTKKILRRNKKKKTTHDAKHQRVTEINVHLVSIDNQTHAPLVHNIFVAYQHKNQNPKGKTHTAHAPTEATSRFIHNTNSKLAKWMKMIGENCWFYVFFLFFPLIHRLNRIQKRGE